MKIGLIADIHGALDGLEQALQLLQSQGVEHIICAGDLTERGPQNAAVVQRIRSLQIPTVQGNHDRAAAIYRERIQQEAVYFEEIYGQPPPEVETLPDETVEYLVKLPVHLRFNWGGVSVLMAHGAPWATDTYIYPHAMIHELRRVMDTANAEVVILGHTHRPMQIDIGTTRIVNPGSVYGNRSDERRTCGLLDLPSRDFTVYDIDSGQAVPVPTRQVQV